MEGRVTKQMSSVSCRRRMGLGRPGVHSEVSDLGWSSVFGPQKCRRLEDVKQAKSKPVRNVSTQMIAANAGLTEGGLSAFAGLPGSPVGGGIGRCRIVRIG